MNRLPTILVLTLLTALCASAQIKPTHSDLRYSPDYDRQLIDLWLPESEHPTPLIIYFHGGGFRKGSKERIPFKRDFLALLDQGIAVASVGYPFLGDQGKQGSISKAGYLQILAETPKAIKYLQTHAKDYNLDPAKFVVAGSSAGALIAEYLTYYEDLGITACLAIQQPYAVPMAKQYMHGGDAPLILYTLSPPGEKIHSPVYAQAIQQHCEEVGIPCTVYGSVPSGLPPLPEGKSIVDVALSTFEANWER